MKVVIVLHHRFELWTAPPWFAERLRHDFPGLDVVQLNDYRGIEDHLRDADIAITWSLRPEQFRAARKLRWIHSTAAAVHQLMFPELVESNVIVTNARQVHGPVVAEHAIALIFAMAKKLPQAMRFQEQHVWAQERLWRDPPMPREVLGATLGLIGLGSIGREVITRAHLLGMHVLAAREHPEKGTDGADEVFGTAQIDKILAAADYVLLAAPLTPTTQQLLNASRLAKMKPSAVVVNVSRGALTDEPALIAALRNKTIAGAALDVFAEEPLPADSPLWDMENVLITPHTAAVSDRTWERHYALVHENLRRFITAEPLLGLVDKRKGY